MTLIVAGIFACGMGTVFSETYHTNVVHHDKGQGESSASISLEIVAFSMWRTGNSICSYVGGSGHYPITIKF